MGAKIVELGNKRRYVAGMQWTSFEAAPAKKDLLEDAERLGASWACIRLGEDAIQAGFCEPVVGSKPIKLYSLAAMVADSRRQPWLGIFRVEDGLWWYIAVRDGHAILPDGDVIGGEEEIRAARDRHSGYTDWEYVEGDISDLLTTIKNSPWVKPSPIRSLHGSPVTAVPLVLAALLTCASLGGYLGWQHWQEVNRQRSLALAKAKVQAAVPPSPLLTLPMPNAWLAACGKVIAGLPLSENGWSLDKVDCLADAVHVHRVRSAGAVVSYRPAGSVSPNGDTVDQSIPLALEKIGKEDAIQLAAAKLRLQAWAQAVGFTLVVTDPPAPLPGAQPTHSDVPPPPPQSLVTLDLPVSPFSMNFEMPGLRWSALTSTASGWHLEGTLYGSR